MGKDRKGKTKEDVLSSAQEIVSLDALFYSALKKRIKKIRKKIRLDKKKYARGKLFNDEESAVDSVVTAITDSTQAYHNGTVLKKQTEDYIEETILSQNAVGLIFSEKSIKSGWYDPLIKEVLKRLAEIDHEKENHEDLH